MFYCQRHLGSFYNDSEKYGGITSSPISHGFDLMNATVEVAPTATTNCECNAEWQKDCDYGHYGKMTHCGGKGTRGLIFRANLYLVKNALLCTFLDPINADVYQSQWRVLCLPACVRV